MAAESFFGRIADDVEKIATRMEEGWNVLMTGELPNSHQQQQQPIHGVGGSGDGGSIDNLDEFDFDGLSEEEIQQLLSEEMMQNSPLAGIADSVLGDIMAGQIGPSTPMEQFHAFRSAIRWTEPFILYIIGFQLLMFVVCIWASQKNRGMIPRLIILFTIGIVVRSSEYINQYANQHWEDFATQNYFDNRGIFIGIMLCGPLLLNCFMMLIMFLREASQLLIQVKKQEMANKKKKKQQQQQEQQSTSTASKSGGGSSNAKKKKTTKTRKED